MKLRRKVLVVDDHLEGVWRETLLAALPMPEWEIENCASYGEAKRRLMPDGRQQHPYDLILLDYYLGDANGERLLAEFRGSVQQRERQDHPFDANTPIMAFSCFAKGAYSSDAPDEFGLAGKFIDRAKVEKRPEKLRDTIWANLTQYMRKYCTPNIWNEYGRLRTVLVHRPHKELERLDTEDLPWYLFDSLPALEAAQREHDEFIMQIRGTTGHPLTLEIGLLLQDVLLRATSEERREIVEAILLSDELKRCGRVFSGSSEPFCRKLERDMDAIAGMECADIVIQLLCGLNIADFSRRRPADPSVFSRRACQIADPMPNLYFMRDPAFCFGRHVFLSKMHKPVRRRETSLLRVVFERHPFFEDGRHRLVNWDDSPDFAFSAEGGDMLALGEGGGERVFAIGTSERTSINAAQSIIRRLFDANEADKIYQVFIPPRRSFMHLDTVFSSVGPRRLLYFHGAVGGGENVTLLWEKSPKKDSFGEYFPKVLNKPITDILGMTAMRTAGGGPLARHEQFDDATNVFMANERAAVVYGHGRNPETNRVLSAAGGKRKEDKINVVPFEGSNLVVGRGGPRCMTMPIQRE